MDCGSCAKDIYSAETTDTLQSLGPVSTDCCTSGNYDCLDDDAASEFESEGSPLSPADTSSMDVLPEAFLNSAVGLEKALSHLESAIQLFAKEASELSPQTCPALDQLVSDVAALRPQVVDRVVPEIAIKFADSMLPKLEPAVSATTQTARATLTPCANQKVKACGSRARRPAPLALNSLKNTVSKATLSPYCGVVTGSPRRLRDPLVEVIKCCKKADVACTLAVWGVNDMGSEALRSLRAYLEAYGEVEMVTRPRIMHATDFALVKMSTALAVDSVLSAGEPHTLEGVEFSLRRLRDFVADLDVEHTV